MPSAKDLASALFGDQPEDKLSLLVCGGRDYSDERTLYIALDALCQDPGIFEIIQGGARGADALALKYGRERHLVCTTFHADWGRDGKAAGPIRNKRMLVEGQPNFVLAFPGGRGTADMLAQAKRAGIATYQIKGALK